MTHPAVDPKVIEAEENLLIDFQFLLQELMTEKGISRSELAALAQLSKPRLTQILSSEANPTIKSVARLFHALGEELCLSRKPLVSDRSEKEPSGSEKEPSPASEKPTEWHWGSETRLDERKDDKKLARIVKQSYASNDNLAPRVMFIRSDVALAPEPESMLKADAA